MILITVLRKLQIDPIHYVVVLIVNMGMATLTPPIGLSLFVLRSLSPASFSDIARRMAPFLALMILLLLVIFSSAAIIIVSWGFLWLKSV